MAALPRPFRCIVAAVGGAGGGIGLAGRIPWKLPEDMKHFQHATQRSTLIMGRKTWASLPTRPLKGRFNLVVTSQPRKVKKPHTRYDQFACVSSLQEALEHPAAVRSRNAPYVIGGQRLYDEAMRHADCEQIEITNIAKCPRLSLYEYDTFMPQLPDAYKLVHSQETAFGAYETWSNTRDANTAEWAYIDALEDIRVNGARVADRTGTGTVQKFGVSLRFPLHGNRIPVLTSKRVHWKSVAEEVLQFARGDVDARKLSRKGVRIWEGNTSRAFLDSVGGAHVETGSMWKAYGWQWRQWGMPYLGLNADYARIRRAFDGDTKDDEASAVERDAEREELIAAYPGALTHDTRIHDQLATVVRQLRDEPTSRRIILNAWNVGDLREMCLPPCHMVYGFNVTHGRLNCQLFQRSWDMFLGAPFNIAGTALLVRLLCAATALEPGEIKIDALNAHIYLNHLGQVDQLCTRARREGLFRSPELLFDTTLNTLDDWGRLSIDDLPLRGYQSHSVIRAKMAV